jgi:carboxypeptidase Taq
MSIGGGICMDLVVQERIGELKDYVKKIEYLSSAMAVLYWDMRVGIPKKGVSQRSEVLGYLSTEAYKLQTSDKMREYIEYFSSLEGLDKVTSSMIERLKKQYDQTKKIPEDRYREYVMLTSEAESKWEEAKTNSDFEMFKPYLQRIVDMQKEFIGYWGYEGNKYNALLDLYEPSITVEKLDEVFGEVRDAIVSLLCRINESGKKPDTSFLQGAYSKASQESLGRSVAAKLGYDFDAGRLDESMHPFTIEVSNRDVRMTTHYYENDLTNALFSTIHESGHAIYEQNISEELRGTGLASGTSMGIHESQSRFYENILGRSKEFWKCFYPEVQGAYPQFENISLEDFYRAINEVKPSLVRVDADELTYSLHIIIRYEIEKMLINDEVKVDDLPEVWNAKYREYLGIEPENNGEGVLQDVHWSGGMIGYFPSYALGNLYGAQFASKMEKDIPDLKSRVEAGNFEAVREWLTENIHRHGSVYKPAELIQRVTGEELSAKYFIDYLERKYSEIYDL